MKTKIQLSILIVLLGTFAKAQLSNDENKCWIYLSKEKADSALIILNDVKNSEKKCAFYYLKGWAEYQKGNIDSSLIHMKKTSDLYEDSDLYKVINTLALSKIGQIYLEKEDTLTAKSYLYQAIDAGCNNERALTLVSEILGKLGDEYGFNKIKLIKFLGEKIPDFKLEDINGNNYNKKSLTEIPLVMHFGTTWCGSCHIDELAFNKFSEFYKNKDITFTHVFIGENPNTVRDFKNHYRSELLCLIDYDYKITNKFNVNYFSTTFLIDTLGINHFFNNDIFYNSKKEKLKQKIDELELKTISHDKVCTKTSCYLPNIIKKDKTYEFSPKAVCDKKGNIWVVFFKENGGNNDIWLRCYKDNNIIKEIPVTRYLSDDYSPCITITSDQKIWIGWVSDLNGNYDIYVSSYYREKLSQPEQITFSHDDAFHPDIFSDKDNNIHLTYYKWDTISHGKHTYSRDRDIYYKKLTNSIWSDEIRISPIEPRWDDASDPSIVVDNMNIAHIAYSYDYHPGSGYKEEVKAGNPTIFMQSLDKNFSPNDQLFIGTEEKNYSSVIDITPDLAIDKQNNIWCSWDALANETRYIFVKNMSEKTTVMVSDPSFNAITPDIYFLNNTPYVVWSQKNGEKWEIFGTKYENGIWQIPVRLVESNYDCKEPQLISGKKKKYIVYSEFREAGSVVRIKKF